MGPIGGARVGYINGEFVLNPHVDEMKECKLDLVVAGTADAVLMVESEAKELREELMLDAVMFGHRGFQPVIDAIIKLAEVAAKEPRDFTAPDYSALEAEMLTIVGDDSAPPTRSTTSRSVTPPSTPSRRSSRPHSPRRRRDAKFTSEQIGSKRSRNWKPSRARGHPRHRQRIDGRDLTTVRQIVAEVGVLPRTHGSALFTRGETQALVVATLGTGEDEQSSTR